LIRLINGLVVFRNLSEFAFLTTEFRTGPDNAFGQNPFAKAAGTGTSSRKRFGLSTSGFVDHFLGRPLERDLLICRVIVITSRFLDLDPLFALFAQKIEGRSRVILVREVVDVGEGVFDVLTGTSLVAGSSASIGSSTFNGGASSIGSSTFIGGASSIGSSTFIGSTTSSRLEPRQVRPSWNRKSFRILNAKNALAASEI
jgi:hypothetical protein